MGVLHTRTHTHALDCTYLLLRLEPLVLDLRLGLVLELEHALLLLLAEVRRQLVQCRVVALLLLLGRRGRVGLSLNAGLREVLYQN